MTEQKITWTKAELKEFDELCDATISAHQVTRISGRMEMNKFIARHGKEKCDAMWAHLEGGAK